MTTEADMSRLAEARRRAEITASLYGVADEGTLADLLWALGLIDTMAARADAVEAAGGGVPKEVQEFIDHVGDRHWENCLGDVEICVWCAMYVKWTTNQVTL